MEGNSNSWGGPRRRRIAGGAISTFGALALVAACASATVTPVPAKSPDQTSGLFTAQPTSRLTYNVPEITPQPTSMSGPVAAPSLPIEFQLAMGKAKLLTPADDNGAQAGQAINAFAFDLLRRINQKGNLCVSPTSIAMALAMVQPGARGDTATQISKVLHDLYSTSNGAELVALLQQFQRDTYYMTADGAPIMFDPATGMLDGTPDGPPIDQVSVANQVFAQKDLPLEPSFLDTLSSQFGAGVGLLDFRGNPEAARLAINKWANDRTNGRIPEILQPGDVDDQTLIFLGNAVFFRGVWDQKFDKADTKARPFYRANGSTVSVPTMYEVQLTSGYAQTSAYRAINLPYQNGTAMTVVVPNDMNSFVSSLSAAKFSQLFMPAKAWLVTLYMPRFSTETRLDLTSTVISMGVVNAFDPSKADLSGIDGRRDIALYTVIHQANIDVDEDGTTAAAVTEIGGKGSAGEPPPRVTFRIDHPFLYFITDTASGAILFMGRVDDPSVKAS